MKENYSLPLTTKEIMDGINNTVEDFYFYRAMPKDNILPLLTFLKDKGIKMCVATATDRYQVEAALRRCGMLEYFGEIFTCSEVGHGKDEPHIFNAARDYLNTSKAETAVFEDAFHGAKTAKEAGFFLVGIYDSYEKRAEELKALADIYLMDFSDTDKLREIFK